MACFTTSFNQESNKSNLIRRQVARLSEIQVSVTCLFQKFFHTKGSGVILNNAT